MDALQIRSQRICVERISGISSPSQGLHSLTLRQIDLVFKRLGPCTRDENALEDFKDSLGDFAQEARACTALATETQIAFSNWGKMVGELHACTENQQGAVSIKRETVAIDQEVVTIEEKFASKAAEAAKENVQAVAKQLEKAEKRLGILSFHLEPYCRADILVIDVAIDKVPGPSESVIQGAVTGFVSNLPAHPRTEDGGADRKN